MKLDGKTTQADAGGVITVKDVAIGGNLGDLASARGQIGHAARVAVADFDTFTATGEYWATWASTANGKPPSGANGFIKVTRFSDSLNIVRQIVYRWGSANVTDWQIFTREQTEVTGQEPIWSDWRYILTDKNIGDGITVNNGIISVPEYEGATASAAGTSGLVPPAAAGQQDMVLTGSGKWVVTPAETFRLSMIGVPRYWRSTTLPAGHVWANGDLALFSDWPELKKVYDGGGFSGMLLAYNADNATIAANLGKWRPNAVNPTGLYVPKLSEQFFRAWTWGGDGLAGTYNAPGLPEIEGHFDGCDLLGDSRADWSGAFIRDGTLYGNVAVAVSGVGIELPTTFSARASNPTYGSSATVMPASVNLPVILYLGLPIQVDKPRYKMTGNRTCAGENSVAACSPQTRAASKTT